GVSVTATVSGLGVRRPVVGGVSSSRVPRDTPAAGTNVRADLRTPIARRGTPVPVATTADGEEPVTGAVR
ncbi:hypothetical protein, partial [Actinopolymorpha rutila]